MVMLALASLASATTAAAAAPTALSTALDAATFYHNGTAHASDGEPHSPMGTSTPGLSWYGTASLPHGL